MKKINFHCINIDRLFDNSLKQDYLIFRIFDFLKKG